jgi:hypothetical protein
MVKSSAVYHSKTGEIRPVFNDPSLGCSVPADINHSRTGLVWYPDGGPNYFCLPSCFDFSPFNGF